MLDVAPIPRVATNQHDVADSLVSSSTPCGSRWAVAQTHPQAERWALRNLENQGYVAWLPLITITRRDPVIRSMTHQIQAPLFSRYLFVQPGTNWPPIAHTRGVARLLMSDGKPHILSDAAVSLLQAVVAAGRHIGAENARLAPGASVAVANGNPFQGHEGVVMAVKRNIATVLLMLFGGLREVRVPLAHLVAR